MMVTMVPSPPEGFPPMWQKPTFEEIIGCLRNLLIEPPVWNLSARPSEVISSPDTASQVAQEATRYLSTIVKSGLEWIQDEERREEVWTEASKRISERCGRAGGFDDGLKPPG